MWDSTACRYGGRGSISFLLLALAAVHGWCASADSANSSMRSAVAGVITPTAIVVPLKATPTERFAAEELRRYVAAMTGAELKILTDEAPPAEGVINVGRTALAAPLANRFDASLAGPGSDSFIIKKDDKGTVIITGGSDRGMLYGVYEFLETQGCRWFFPGKIGEHVPMVKTLSLPYDEKVFTPDFVQREIDLGPFEGVSIEELVDWCTKNRLNRDFAAREARFITTLPKEKRDMWSKRGGQMKWEWHCHNLDHMLPTAKFFAEHPDYYALYKGERLQMGVPGKPYYGGGNLCTTNPEVIRKCADFAIDWFSRNPDGVVVPVWPNDGAIKWCECPECKKLGGMNFMAGEKGSMSKRMVTFANAVARIVGEKYPDRLILCPAYANYVLNPKIPLEKNVLLQYCLHGCYAHGVDKCPANAEEKSTIDTWAESAKGRMGVWEYFLLGDFTSTQNAESPAMLPVIYRVRDTFAYLHGRGVNWYFTQSSPKYWRHNILPFYLTARLAWSSTQDFDALLKDYCAGMFGAAAVPVERYYRTIEDAVAAAAWHPQLYADIAAPSTKVFTKELIQKCGAVLAEAEACPLEPLQKERLKLVKETFEHTISNIGLAGDIGLDANATVRIKAEADCYVMNVDGTDVTEEKWKIIAQQAMDTGKYTPEFERTLFRARKRQIPLAHLENDSLKVSILPELGGRIVKIVDKATGRNYLKGLEGGAVEASIGQKYINYGGYEEYVGNSFGDPGWETPFCVDPKDGKEGSAIVMKGSVDSFSLVRTIALPKGDSRRLSVSSVLTNSGKEKKRIRLRTHPAFTFGDACSSFAVLFAEADGTEKRTTLGALNDVLSASSGGFLAVINEKEDVGVAEVFDPKEANPYLCITGKDSFNLELFGLEKELAPGESLKLAHELVIMRQASKELEAARGGTQGGTP